jgi:hypothetical protein
MHHKYTYSCTCVRDGYGRACGCTASHAHVRAIARADTEAVAIMCACVGTSAGIYSQLTRHVKYICTYIGAKSGCVHGYACVLLHTRAYACGRVRAPTMRGYAACARVRCALFVRPSIGGTRTYTAYAYLMHACIYIHARLATPTNGSPMQARRTHSRTCCVRARARVRVCDLAPTHPRRHMRARSVGDGPRVARLAGVLLCGGVQREHRRVEHRACHRLEPGMRRLSGPGGAATAGGTRSAGWSVRRGPLCAAAPPMRARACAAVWARACAGVHVRRYSCA